MDRRLLLKKRPMPLANSNIRPYRQSVYIGRNIIDFFKAKRYLSDSRKI